MARNQILRDIAENGLDPKVKYHKTASGKLQAPAPHVFVEKTVEKPVVEKKVTEKVVAPAAKPVPAKPKAEEPKAKVESKTEEVEEKKSDVTQ